MAILAKGQRTSTIFLPIHVIRGVVLWILLKLSSSKLPQRRIKYAIDCWRKHRAVQNPFPPGRGRNGLKSTWRRTNGCAVRSLLKLLFTDVTRNEDWVRRFEQEAYAASALNHPTSSLSMKSDSSKIRISSAPSSSTARRCASDCANESSDHRRDARHRHSGGHRAGGCAFSRHHPSRHQA